MTVASDLAQIIGKSDISGVSDVSATSGLQSSMASLKGLSSLSGVSGVYYNQALKTIVITKAGVTLDGYNFSGVSVIVQADNVTLKNSYFDATTGSYSVKSSAGTANLTIENSTFDGLKLNNTSYNDFVASYGANTIIANNSFLNAPNDAISIVSGSISGNYIAGGGYATGAHSDAIWISQTTGSVVISDNIIDWRASADAAVATNNAVRITGESGDVNDVLVTHNVILGGSTSVLVSDGATQTHTAAEVGSVTDVRVVDNVVDYSLYGDLEQTSRPADMVYSDNLHVSGALVTPGAEAVGAAPDTSHLLKVVATTATSVIKATAADSYLVGGSGSNAIYGGKGDDVIFGGDGRDYISGGGGHNTFVYTSVKNSGIDLINDFNRGSDKISLAGLDGAPTTLADWQWLGNQSFTGHAWQIRVNYASGLTTIQVDVDGDLKADFQLQLSGTVNVSTSDFILVNAAQTVANTMPTMSGIASGTIVAGSGSTATGLLTFADADASNTLTTSITKQVVQYIDSLGVERTSSLTGSAVAALTAGFTMPVGSLASSHGSSAWSYAANNPALAFLGAGETATITSVVQVNDGAGGTVSDSVAVTVTGVNDAPTITDPGTLKVTETAGLTSSNATLSQQGVISFADLDISDGHSVTVVNAAGARGYKGTLAVAVTSDSTNGGQGKITWTFSALDRTLDYLAAGEVLRQTYTVTLSDGHGGVKSQDIQVNIIGTNDVPKIAGSAVASWTEGSASTYLKSGTLTFNDADVTDHLSTSISSQSVTLTNVSGKNVTSEVSAAQIAALESAFTIKTGDIGSNAGSAAWTFASADKAFDFLGQNDILKLVNTVTVSDGHGGVATQDVVLTVRGVNDAPVIIDRSHIAGSIAETQHTTGDTSVHQTSGIVTFSDQDMADVHSVRAVAKGTGYLGTLTPVVLQESAQGGEGKISWTFQVADKALDSLGANQTLTQIYTLQVSDGKGGLVSQDVTVTLTGSSDQFTYQSATAKTLSTFADGDTISVNGSAFGGGLSTGTLASSFFSSTNSTTTSSHGQFYQDASHTHLYWDADGTGGKAPVAIATFAQAHAIHAADILVI